MPKPGALNGRGARKPAGRLEGNRGTGRTKKFKKFQKNFLTGKKQRDIMNKSLMKRRFKRIDCSLKTKQCRKESCNMIKARC